MTRACRRPPAPATWSPATGTTRGRCSPPSPRPRWCSTDQDRLTPPENASLLAERLPDARVHLLPGARHAYFEECRDTAGAPVRAFLA
ncbi:alpha/beta fold hydrolase [Streptomyces sp. NPDC060322]|uniref:alpha/beta fold hydrolase n=1 Tax=Streptomyces sp. NPDC060322 TaxID=3347097 RepID=UPI00365ED6F3